MYRQSEQNSISGPLFDNLSYRSLTVHSAPTDRPIKLNVLRNGGLSIAN
jgi:hypothetical protein